MTNENRPSYLVEIKSRGVKHKRSTYDVYANRVILTLIHNRAIKLFASLLFSRLFFSNLQANMLTTQIDISSVENRICFYRELYHFITFCT